MRLSPPSAVLWFFVKAGVIYTVFLLPWISLHEAYSATYRACANAVFGSFGAAGRLQFRPAPPEFPEHDVQLSLTNVKTNARGTMEMNTRSLDYLPAAFLVALTLATPVSWERRVRALLWGLLLMSAYAGFRLIVRLLDVFGENPALGIFSPSPLVDSTVDVLMTLFSLSPVTGFMMPVLIWILATFRREDLTHLAFLRPPESPAVGSHPQHRR